jgi:ABC-type Fe3+/spermidine/putrescine transport system ATPase subunit
VQTFAIRVAQALQLVRLEGYEWRKPHELSGEQEQRVTRARPGHHPAMEAACVCGVEE